MDKTEAGRLLASLRPVGKRVCPVCGKTFDGVGRRRYCSRSCKLHAQYKRRSPEASRRGPQHKAAGEGQAEPSGDGRLTTS